METSVSKEHKSIISSLMKEIRPDESKFEQRVYIDTKNPKNSVQMNLKLHKIC